MERSVLSYASSAFSNAFFCSSERNGDVQLFRMLNLVSVSKQEKPQVSQDGSWSIAAALSASLAESAMLSAAPPAASDIMAMAAFGFAQQLPMVCGGLWG